MQYFKGRVERSTLVGQMLYEPAYPSVFRRAIHAKEGQIIECVFQKDQVSVVELNRGTNKRTYRAREWNGTFAGQIVYKTEALTSWSYYLEVLRPEPGKITGALANGNGARLDPKTGQLEITKIWNDQVRLHEVYMAIDAKEYKEFLELLPPEQLTPEVRRLCIP